MRSHGGAGGVGITAGDGRINVLVLPVDAVEVFHLIVPRQLGGVDAGAGDDHHAQMGHDLDVVPVGRRAHDLEVKLKVRGHRIRGQLHAFLKGIQRAPHSRQLIVGAPHRRHSGGFSLQPNAQLEHRQDVAQHHDGRRIDVESLVGSGIEHERPDAVARFHHPGRLQT